MRVDRDGQPSPEVDPCEEQAGQETEEEWSPAESLCPLAQVVITRKNERRQTDREGEGREGLDQASGFVAVRLEEDLPGIDPRQQTDRPDEEETEDDFLVHAGTDVEHQVCRPMHRQERLSEQEHDRRKQSGEEHALGAEGQQVARDRGFLPNGGDRSDDEDDEKAAVKNDGATIAEDREPVLEEGVGGVSARAPGQQNPGLVDRHQSHDHDDVEGGPARGSKILAKGECPSVSWHADPLVTRQASYGKRAHHHSVPRTEYNPSGGIDLSDDLLRAAAQEGEKGIDLSLRPQGFSEFVGQEAVKRNLDVYIKAARMRGDCLDHLLLSGLPGLGKTTLAEIVAREMGSTLHNSSGPAIDRAGDLAGLLTNMERGDIFFIDEIHRLPAVVEEFLYSAMEDFSIDIILDQGPSGRSVRINIEPFTLVGATTREGLLSAPFRDRFGVLERLETYPVEQLETIARRSAGILDIGLEPAGATALAQHARGTPRIVNRFLRRIRDLAQVEGRETIDADVAERGLRMLGVDDDGLLRVDRQILETIALAGGQPVGLKTIAISVGEDERTVEDVYEPHLLRSGLLLKTSRGRLLTAPGYTIIGAAAPPVEDAQGRLFPEDEANAPPGIDR